MGIRTLAICATASLLLGGGFAVAQTNQTSGDTSGPAAGSNVSPSTAVQKNRSSSKDSDQTNSTAAGGAPGVAGPAGSKNGPAPNNRNQ